jgi:hypothetical protein
VPHGFARSPTAPSDRHRSLSETESMGFFGLAPGRVYDLISLRCFAPVISTHIPQPLCICVMSVRKLRTGQPLQFSQFVDLLICWYFEARALLWDDMHVWAAPMILSYVEGELVTKTGHAYACCVQSVVNSPFSLVIRRVYAP